MSNDSTRLLLPERGSEAEAYRPISGLAVASISLAGAYAAAVAVLGTVALVTRAPLFLPGWTFLMPVAGLALGLAARLQVRRAEGTRTGAGLADWGIRLALLFGLGYTAFYVGTYLAVVRVEAQRFTRDWLAKVRSTDPAAFNEAFLLTRPPDKRQRDDPSNQVGMKLRYGMRGHGATKPALELFNENEFVRVVRGGGPQTEIECLGVREWDYRDGGYYVAQTYLVHTPEGVFEAQIDVLRTEGKDFKGRQWQVIKGDHIDFRPLHLYPLGEALRAWRQDAPAFVQAWLRRRDSRRLQDSFIETRDVFERPRLVGEYQGRTVLAALAALAPGPAGQTTAALAAGLGPLTDPALARDLYLPGFHGFVAGNVVRCDPKELEAADDVKDDIVRIVKNNFNNPDVFGMRPTGTFLTVVDADRGVVRAKVDLEIGLRRGGQSMAPDYNCVGDVVLQSSPLGPPTPERPPGWYVVAVEVTGGGRLMGAGEMKSMQRGGVQTGQHQQKRIAIPQRGQ